MTDEGNKSFDEFVDTNRRKNLALRALKSNLSNA